MMSAAIVAAALALASGSGEEEAPAKQPEPVATCEHVRVAARGKEWSGWLLDPESEGGYALLADEGEFRLLPSAPPPKVLERTLRPVTEAPSAALVAGLGHASERIRERCEELLLEQGSPALAPLGEALVDRSAETRRRALGIVATQAPRFPKQAKRLLRRVTGCLNDGDERVRQAALHAWSLYEGQEHELLARCTDLLKLDASELVRHEAILCLGRTRDPHAIDPLLAHLEGCDSRSLRLVTFDSLRRLTGRNLKRDEEAWRAWWTNHRTELLPEEVEEEDEATDDGTGAPEDGAGPDDGTAPEDGVEPDDGTTPDDGAAPDDDATPDDGTSPDDDGSGDDAPPDDDGSGDDVPPDDGGR